MDCPNDDPVVVVDVVGVDVDVGVVTVAVVDFVADAGDGVVFVQVVSGNETVVEVNAVVNSDDDDVEDEDDEEEDDDDDAADDDDVAELVKEYLVLLSDCLALEPLICAIPLAPPAPPPPPTPLKPPPPKSNLALFTIVAAPPRTSPVSKIAEENMACFCPDAAAAAAAAAEALACAASNAICVA